MKGWWNGQHALFQTHEFQGATSRPRRSRWSRAYGRQAQSLVGGEVLRERGHPDDAVDDTGTGSVTLDLSSPATAQLNGIVNNYLDTLHSDYGFIIALNPVHQNMVIPVAADTVDKGSNWDFGLYPNPAGDVLNVVLPDDIPKSLTIYDLSGRQVRGWGSVSGPLLRLPVDKLARGAYTVRVSDEVHSQVKQLIIR